MITMITDGQEASGRMRMIMEQIKPLNLHVLMLHDAPVFGLSGIVCGLLTEFHGQVVCTVQK
jgi:hypothetical protein